MHFCPYSSSESKDRYLITGAGFPSLKVIQALHWIEKNADAKDFKLLV